MSLIFFYDACQAVLLAECQGLPLVGRQDTALRPVATALSEDICMAYFELC